MKLAVALILTICGATAAPTTFPYENEAYVPPNMLDSTPDYTYLATDPGGYHYTHIWMVDLNTRDMPYCAMTTNCNQYTLVETYKLPPELPLDVFNCSKNGLTFDASVFTGVVNGLQKQTVCNLGECCQDYYGFPKFSDDQLDWHNWLDTLSKTGRCSEPPTEAIYCALVNGHSHGNCFWRYQTPLEREIVLPCPDNYYHFWVENCPVYRNVMVSYGLNPEPPIYYSQSSFEQTLLIELSVEENDHICHPYSYYNPDVNVDSKSPTNAESKTSGESAAGFVFSTLALLFLSF